MGSTATLPPDEIMHHQCNGCRVAINRPVLALTHPRQKRRQGDSAREAIFCRRVISVSFPSS
jgi:hypothetical protein